MTEKNQTSYASVPSGNGPTNVSPTGCDGEVRAERDRWRARYGDTEDALHALAAAVKAALDAGETTGREGAPMEIPAAHVYALAALVSDIPTNPRVSEPEGR